MNEQSGVPLGRDHNNPPELLPVLPLGPSEEAMREAVDQVYAMEQDPSPAYDPALLAQLSLRVTDFCDACGAWKDLKIINSQEQAGRLTDFINGARALEKQVEEARVAAKKPWDEKGDKVQVAFKPLKTKMEAIKKMMADMAADFLNRENARIAAEQGAARRAAQAAADEAARLAEQAAARNDVSGMVDAGEAVKAAADALKAAEKPVSAKMDSASGGGRAISMRTQAYAEVTNWRAVFMHFENNHKVREVLQSLADAAVRAGADVAGATRKTRQVAA